MLGPEGSLPLGAGSVLVGVVDEHEELPLWLEDGFQCVQAGPVRITFHALSSEREHLLRGPPQLGMGEGRSGAEYRLQTVASSDCCDWYFRPNARRGPAFRPSLRRSLNPFRPHRPAVLDVHELVRRQSAP
jgi:hypothetical protein